MNAKRVSTLRTAPRHAREVVHLVNVTGKLALSVLAQPSMPTPPPPFATAPSLATISKKEDAEKSNLRVSVRPSGRELRYVEFLAGLGL